MSTTFAGRSFRGLYDDCVVQRVIAGYELISCKFTSSRFSITRDPAKRSVARDIRVIDCSLAGCALEAGIVEDSYVQGLKGFLPCYATAFKHVMFKCRIESLQLSDAVQPGVASAEVQKAFQEANARYYAGVDWAIDISQAEFGECDIRSIPAALVRRDPETQVVVKRERLLDGAWLDVDLSDTPWQTGLEFFFTRGTPDVVLVASKGDKKHFKAELAGLQRLRKAGIAEPD